MFEITLIFLLDILFKEQHFLCFCRIEYQFFKIT